MDNFAFQACDPWLAHIYKKKGLSKTFLVNVLKVAFENCARSIEKLG